MTTRSIYSFSQKLPAAMVACLALAFLSGPPIVPEGALQGQSIVGTITHPGLVPYRVAVYEAGNKVIVADNAAGNLEFYDGTSLALLGSVYVGAGVKEMVVEESSGKLYAALADGTHTQRIAVCDARNHTLLRYIGGDFAGYSYASDSLVLDAAARKLYAAGWYDFDYHLHQIDTTDDTATALSTDMMAWGYVSMALNPVTHELFVSNFSKGKLFVINGATLATEEFDFRGFGVTVDPSSNKVFLPDGLGGGASVFDRNSNTFTYLEYSNDATKVIYSAASRRVYSSAEVDAKSTIIDTPTGTVHHVAMRGATTGLGSMEATRHVYYANPEEILVFDDASGSLASIPVSNPHADEGGMVISDVALNQTTGRVYAINDQRWSVVTVLQDSVSVAVPPAFETQPLSQSVAVGGTATFTVTFLCNPMPTLQWRCNGSALEGCLNATLTINNVQPRDAGIYTAEATKSDAVVQSQPAIVGLTTTAKVSGDGQEVLQNQVHPNGNAYDQVLVTGTAEAIIADYSQNQITRTSFIDLDGDIVQVEFSGPGTLSLVLDPFTGSAPPLKYNQAVTYAMGHAGIVIAGADERTNVSVFSVGRATAFDPTGAYDILLLPNDTTNNPASNGSPLFQGHGATSYDGVADIAFIAISSANGRFGGIRTANANYFAAKGHTGVYAPGVAFQGPIFIGDVIAGSDAIPVIIVGAASDVRITGGDLLQDNSQPVQVSGFTQLRFTAGQDSHGRSLPAQRNQAVLQCDGQDVTSQIVVNP